MQLDLPELIAIALLLITLSLHVVRSHIMAINLYRGQSALIVLLLLISYLDRGTPMVLAVALLTLLVKVFLAPRTLSQPISRYKVRFSVNTYLNLPLTFLVFMALSLVAQSPALSHITNINPDSHSLLTLSLTAMLASIFLVINHRGALAQILGVLSLENCILAFAMFAGLEQSSVLEIGILFDLFIWFSLATVLLAMIQRHFGSLDMAAQQHLKE